MTTLDRYGEIPDGEYIELRGSGRLVESIDGFRATRLLVCNWRDKLKVAPDIGQHFSSDLPWLYCTDVVFEPLGPGKKYDNDVKYCHITAEYDSRRPNQGNETIEWVSQALTLTEGRVWVSDSSLCEVPTAIPMPLREHIIEVVYNPLPLQAIDNLENCLNVNNWRGIFGPGRVLFSGASVRSECGRYGNKQWRAYLRFVVAPRDHNYVWRGDLGMWDRLQPNLYNYGDFNALQLPVEFR